MPSEHLHLRRINHCGCTHDELSFNVAVWCPYSHQSGRTIHQTPIPIPKHNSGGLNLSTVNLVRTTLLTPRDNAVPNILDDSSIVLVSPASSKSRRMHNTSGFWSERLYKSSWAKFIKDTDDFRSSIIPMYRTRLDHGHNSTFSQSPSTTPPAFVAVAPAPTYVYNHLL